MYWWDGKVNTDAELILKIKTRSSLVPALTAHVKSLVSASSDLNIGSWLVHCSRFGAASCIAAKANVKPHSGAIFSFAA